MKEKVCQLQMNIGNVVLVIRIVPDITQVAFRSTNFLSQEMRILSNNQRRKI
jgi:hypothetical protein